MPSMKRKEHEPEPLDFWIGCDWQYKPLTFAGFSAEEIAGLIQIVGTQLGITPDQAPKIFIHLSDYMALKFPNREPIFTTGVCAPQTDENGVINRCHIIINRSREVFDLPRPKPPSVSVNHQEEPKFDGPIKAELTAAWEFLVWIVTEELSHAQVDLKAGDPAHILQWSENYRGHLFNKGFEDDGSYSFDLVEVTAARQVLRVLAKLSLQFAPERAKYFRELYHQSLSERKAVTPVFSQQVIDQVFVKTDFHQKLQAMQDPESQP